MSLSVSNGNAAAQQDFNITVDYALTLSNSSIAENATAGTLVGRFSAVATDAGSEHNFSLTCNDGNFSTTLDGNLSSDVVFDYESTPTQSVCVAADDGAGTVDYRTFSIAITGVNDAPVWNTENNATNEDVNFDVNLSHYISDVDSSSFMFSAESNNTSLASVSINGDILTILPQSDQNGIITVTVYGSRNNFV